MHEYGARQVYQNGLLTKLNQLTSRARQLVLYILARTGEEIVELHPAGASQPLPDFCQVFRRSAEGERRCQACRSRVATGALVRGLSEYACHGGISVIAAPAILNDGGRSDRLVVAACVVARRSHASAWRTAAADATDIGVDIDELRRACFALPAFTEDTLPIVTGTIDLAASILGEFEERLEDAVDSSGPPAMPKYRRCGRSASSMIGAAPTHRGVGPAGMSSGSAVVDSAVAAVMGDPSLPHSVAGLARGAGVTPNYLSALFRKHTGQTFREFLVGARIQHACGLLKDVRLSVGDVGLRAGFEDPAYFSRRFRQVTGCTPTQWRNGICDADRR